MLLLWRYRGGRSERERPRLPNAIADRLTDLSIKSGYPKSWYIQQAILRYLDELEEAQAEQSPPPDPPPEP